MPWGQPQVTTYFLFAQARGFALLEWGEYAALLIEVIAVTIIVASLLVALTRYLVHRLIQRAEGDHYRALRVSVGKSLLLGLEVLVAADIVRTVALEETLQSILILGLLVLVRTFLSWALVVEIEGHWPWQRQLASKENSPKTE
jgi:uncharacterized membrane protein